MIYRKLAVLALLILSLGAVAATEEPVDFTLPTLSGENAKLADFRGQWVVVNFWATWCAPCRKEIPDLSKMHDANEDITVLGLAYEEVEAADLLVFLEDYPATYPILLVDVYDPPKAFGIPKALPTTIVLNPAGIPVKTFVGPVTSEQITGFIRSVE